MEANICLPTRHFPAMRNHKTVLVHSSVRLPALQAKIGPPPGAARVAAVGAGVVLTCALGTMYWKRARALQFPMHCSNQTSYGGNGGASDHPPVIRIEELHDLLSEICIRKLDSKPRQLTVYMHQCLAQTQKDVNSYLMTRLLEEKFHKAEYIGEDEYNLGIVLILALISEKNYTEAKEICNQLKHIEQGSDRTPHLLLDIINMMMAKKSMLQFDSEKNQEEFDKIWDDYKRSGNAGFPMGGPPDITKN